MVSSHTLPCIELKIYIVTIFLIMNYMHIYPAYISRINLHNNLYQTYMSLVYIHVPEFYTWYKITAN
jgi:hypothetical protein